MEFIIIFKCETYYNFPVEIKDKRIGLYLLDRIKEGTDITDRTIIQNIPYNRSKYKSINCNYSNFIYRSDIIRYDNYSLFLTEDEVRSNNVLFNVFKNTSILYVIVPGMFLNQFMRLKLIVDNCTMKYEYELDEETLLKRWIDIGCKTEWQENIQTGMKKIFRIIGDFIFRRNK